MLQFKNTNILQLDRVRIAFLSTNLCHGYVH